MPKCSEISALFLAKYGLMQKLETKQATPQNVIPAESSFHGRLHQVLPPFVAQAL